MGETWLQCPVNHMIKPEDGYEEGDTCPAAGDCSVSDSKGVLRKVEKSEERLKAGDKINQYMEIEENIQEPEDVNIKYTPYEASYKLYLHLRSADVRDIVRNHGREYVIELLEAHDKVYALIPKHWQKFKENPYTLCLDCDTVCKTSDQMKLHESKQHRVFPEGLSVLYSGDYISLRKHQGKFNAAVELRRFTTLSEINLWINYVELGLIFSRDNTWKIQGRSDATFTLKNEGEALELFNRLREKGKKMERKKLEESDPGLKQDSASRASKNERPIEAPEDQSLNGGDD